MKVLVTGRLTADVVAMLSAEHEVEMSQVDHPMDRAELMRLVRDKDGLLCTISDKIDEELLQLAASVKMIANYGVGYDNVDLQAATNRKIPVSNTPGVLTDATADLTFALILGVARRLVEGDKRTRSGEFRFWAPLLFLGRDVSGKTLGIVGMGQIAKAVVRRAKGFGMRVMYHSRTRLDPQEEGRLGVEHVSLDDLLRRSDFVSLHVPLTEQTRHLISTRELTLMKPTAYLINTSRGPVVDERPLFNALKEKRIQGAGLDVYEHEPALTPGLTDLTNVILLPHVGSATLETRTKMGTLAATNLLAGLRGETPPNCLNCNDIQLL
jgi:glyoxylate reductase